MPSIAQGNTTFVPSFDATARAQFMFSRSPETFMLSDYAAMRKVDRMVGFYWKGDNQQASRVVDPKLHEWADAASGMPDNEGQGEFDFPQFNCHRDKFDLVIGDLAAEQADFDVAMYNSNIVAQRAMTNRTLKAQNALAAANWGANTSACTALAGGKWDVSTPAQQFILKSFNLIKAAIFKATQGAVPPDSLRCVISPNCAGLLRQAPEIVDFIKQMQYSFEIMSQADKRFLNRWSLPPYLYGVKMVVEDAVRTSTSKGNPAPVKAYTLADTVAYFLTQTVDVVGEIAENGELPPGQGVALYDTLTQFVKEDMTMETLDDRNNRRQIVRCTNNYDSVVTAPESGYYLTACTG